MKFTQKHLCEVQWQYLDYERQGSWQAPNPKTMEVQRGGRWANKNIASVRNGKVRARLNMSAREKCTGRCDHEPCHMPRNLSETFLVMFRNVIFE